MFTALYVLAFALLIGGFAWTLFAENMLPGIIIIAIGMVLGISSACINENVSKDKQETPKIVTVIASGESRSDSDKVVLTLI